MNNEQRQMKLDWVIATIEHKGCFGVNAERKTKKPSEYRQLNPTFQITFKEKELVAMRKFHKFMDFGNITYQDNKKYLKNDKTSNAYKYNISGKHDAVKFIKRIPEKKFLTTKQEQYRTWAKIVNITSKNTLSELTSEQMNMLERLKTKLAKQKTIKE